MRKKKFFQPLNNKNNDKLQLLFEYIFLLPLDEWNRME